MSTRLSGRPSYITEPKSWDVDLLDYVSLVISGGGGGGGDATAANQATEIASLSSMDGKLPALVGGRVPVVLPAGGSGLTDAELRATAVPVSAASLPLPAGAATAAKQDTGNTSLGSLDTKLPTQGQALAAASLPVVLTAAQITTLTPPAAITGFATEATLSTLNGKVTAVNTGAVVVSSSALPSGAATAALQTQPGVDIGDVTVNNAAGASAVNVQDGGNSLTVDGSVTANAGTNLNTSALALDASIGTLTTAVNTLLKPASTLAAVTAITTVVHVDDNAGSLTVDGAVTVSGTVAVSNMIPAVETGLATAAAQTTGNASLATLAGAVKTEDSAAASGDAGVAVLGVRQDFPVETTSAQGDYAPFKIDKEGRVWIASDALALRLDTIAELLQHIYNEQRINTEVMRQGLNVIGSLDLLRNDPFIVNNAN